MRRVYSYDRRAVSKPVPSKAIAEEIVDETAKEIGEFLSKVIIAGQEVSKSLSASEERVRGYYAGDPVAYRDLRAALIKRIKTKWGNDAMVPYLADVIGKGEYVF